MNDSTPARQVISHDLTGPEKSLIADITAERAALDSQLQGVLRMALRARGLKGTYALDNGKLAGSEPDA